MKKLLLLPLAFALLAVALISAEVDYVATISQNKEIAAKLGLAKLSDAERAEWNRLLGAVYRLGIDSAKNTPGVSATPLESVPPRGPQNTSISGSIWLSKADLNGEDIIKLTNGAVFEVSAGYTGYGYNRDVALIKDGIRWSIWIEGKREYRGSLLRAPDAGRASGFKRSSITSISSDGSILKLLDGSVYEVSIADQIDTSLWLPVSEVIVIDESSLLNLSGAGGGIVQVVLLK